MDQDATVLVYGGIGLGPGDIVLDGDPAGLSPLYGHSRPPPIFGQCPLWPNSWMDWDATWHGGI